ncbi:MAG: peptidoglycan-binding domain-containing protein [Paracoccaceae bacterium]|jgi:molybdopterin-binding protein|nr:peptidoglycan-binding domain-containing protein [Paracoccaceae bacterium]
MIRLTCLLPVAALVLAACTPADPPLPDAPPLPTLAGEWRAQAPQPGEGGCFARQTRPAVVETVTEQVLTHPELRDPKTGAVTRPAAYRTSTHQRIVEGRAEMWFKSPCAADLTPEFVASLQRALKARGLFKGAVSGVIDPATSAAIRAYQAPRGLFSATLSTRAAQELGLIAWLE